MKKTKSLFTTLLCYIILSCSFSCSNQKKPNLEIGTNFIDSTKTPSLDTTEIRKLLKSKQKLLLDYWGGMNSKQYKFVSELLLKNGDFDSTTKFLNFAIRIDTTASGEPYSCCALEVFPEFYRDSLIEIRLKFPKDITYTEDPAHILANTIEGVSDEDKKEVLKKYSTKYGRPVKATQNFQMIDSFFESYTWSDKAGKTILVMAEYSKSPFKNQKIRPLTNLSITYKYTPFLEQESINKSLKIKNHLDSLKEKIRKTEKEI